MFPFLFLLAGQSAQWMQWKRSRSLTVVLGIAILASLLPFRYHPHHLAYFNEFAGGPLEGKHHLLDSNLDWGQDLAGLKEFVDAHSIENLHLAYFGTVPPEEYGISYRLPAWQSSEPGWYAVSVNFVQGRPHVIRDETGNFKPVGPYEFSDFQLFEPRQRIGYSIYIYHLNELDILRWQAAMRKRIPL